MHPNISVGTCEIEFLEEETSYTGNPASRRSEAEELVGSLRRFKVTSLDELDLLVGLLEWPTGEAEVRPLELLGGLQKHNALDNRGGMSLVESKDNKWLVPLRVLKFNSERKYFTLHSVAFEEINSYLGHSFEDFLRDVGALRVRTREAIDGDTSRTSRQLAMVVEPSDIQTIAVAYTVTRPLAVINDFGMN